MKRNAHISVNMLAATATVAAVLSLAAPAAHAVTHVTGTVNGLAVDIWSWTDASGKTRSMALKQEGNGNPGHGGYAIQMTYKYRKHEHGRTATINAADGPLGGFGYFISHERYRNFADGTVDTIADHIFQTANSPPGLDFPATASFPTTPAGTGAERFVIQYSHYGTNFVDPFDQDTGKDSILLPAGAANYTLYTLPVTTTWVMQDGQDYPRIDIAVGLGDVTLNGVATADLVSFDLAGPYGALQFNKFGNAVVDTVQWGDQAYRFMLDEKPITRDSTWDWSVPNTGARYHALIAQGFEMGLFEPVPLSQSATTDGYAGERSFTAASYAAQGGISYSSCPGNIPQILPTDGDWPYESVQFSLSCADFNATTTAKNMAWGSVPYYGTSLTTVSDGQRNFAFNGFPSSGVLQYGVCLVLDRPPHSKSQTEQLANRFAKKHPDADCATTIVP